MSRQPKFTVNYAPETLDHLDAIERKYHHLIQKAVEQQLRYTPQTATRNRKPVEQPAPFSATWELRCGPHNRFRVFYDIDTAEQTVWVGDWHQTGPSIVDWWRGV